MRTPESESERRANQMAQLASDIEVAGEVIALWEHPAVKEWFVRREAALVEAMLTAPSDQLELARARITAHRDLANLMGGMLAGRNANTRKLQDLRKHENSHAR